MIIYTDAKSQFAVNATLTADQEAANAGRGLGNWKAGWLACRLLYEAAGGGCDGSKMHIIEYAVNPSDMEPDGYTKEIGWRIFIQPVNQYGFPDGERKFFMNGAYINHGSKSEPQWSSHS